MCDTFLHGTKICKQNYYQLVFFVWCSIFSAYRLKLYTKFIIIVIYIYCYIIFSSKNCFRNSIVALSNIKNSDLKCYIALHCKKRYSLPTICDSFSANKIGKIIINIEIACNIVRDLVIFIFSLIKNYFPYRLLFIMVKFEFSKHCKLCY